MNCLILKSLVIFISYKIRFCNFFSEIGSKVFNYNALFFCSFPAGLNWEPVVYEEYDGMPGQVIYQSVEAHTEVEKGTIIAFTISIEPALPPEVTIQYPVTLMETDSELVEVWIMVDGMTVYNVAHDPTVGSVTVDLTAMQGEHLVEVYQNRVPYSSEVVLF